MPEPGLPGTALRRIVVGADARYLTTGGGSVAVVGGDGGLSLIDRRRTG
ncbi:MAG: hypothetical protein R2695_20135 [Acidimicrobiales bacterium]